MIISILFFFLKKRGFVFQSFNLLSSLTAQENVELPMTLKGILNPSQRKKHAIGITIYFFFALFFHTVLTLKIYISKKGKRGK